MFTSTGIILYDPPRPGMKRKTKNWVIIKVDREITRYFRYWVNKQFNPLELPELDIKQPSWDAHISVVRGERIDPSKQHLWKKHQGQKVTFTYDLNVHQASKEHFWIVDARCSLIDDIRNELGLKTFYRYHLTIGRYSNEE